MKQISKKLSLKKKTVAVLNNQELNQVVGGKRATFGNGCPYETEVTRITGAAC